MDWSPDDFFSEQKRLKRTMSIDKYRNDAVVIRSYKTTRVVVPPTDHTIGGTPSKKSLSRLVFLLNNCDVPMVTMHTLTFQLRVAKILTPEVAKLMLKEALRKLRREGGTNYVWVREFTKKGAVHYHVFSDFVQQSEDEVDAELSKKWSKWWGRLARRRTGNLIGLDEQYRLMEVGNGKDFLGSVRIERLRDSAAGRYAGKEGAKRFQKVAPAGWSKAGRWWANSQSLTCTPLRRVQVRVSSLKSSNVTLPDGTCLDVPFKNQFGRGHSVEDGD